MHEPAANPIRDFLRRERVLFILLVVIFVIRLPAGWYVTHQKVDFYMHNDGFEYLQLAKSIARGDGFMKDEPMWYEGPRDEPIPEPYRPIGLSLLGAVFLLANPDSLFGLFIMQSLFYLVLLAMVRLMAVRLYGQTAGWLALIMVGLHPFVMTWSFRFSSEMLFAVMLMAFIWQWWRLKGWQSYAWLGLIIALANYVRPTALLLVPVAVVILAWQVPWRKWALILCFVAAFVLGMAPHMIRNYVNYGSPKITTFYGGYAFWLGNNQANLKAYRSTSGADFLHWQGVAFEGSKEMARTMPEEIHDSPPAQDAWWFSQAFDEIGTMGLVAWADLLTRRAWHFFRPWPLVGAHPPKVFWITTIVELVVFALGFMGLIRQLKLDYRKLLPMGVVLACGAGGHILVFVVMRYRVPFLDVPLLLVGAGYVACLVQRHLPGIYQRLDPQPAPVDATSETA